VAEPAHRPTSRGTVYASAAARERGLVAASPLPLDHGGDPHGDDPHGDDPHDPNGHDLNGHDLNGQLTRTGAVYVGGMYGGGTYGDDSRDDARDDASEAALADESVDHGLELFRDDRWDTPAETAVGAGRS
jgi:hypothetical protein